MVKSFGAFIFGILKRIPWLLPSLLSDPFDIAERWLGMNYNAPHWLFWVLLGIGYFIAAFLTYNDVKRKLDKIEEEFFFEPTGISVTTKTGSVHLNATFRVKPSAIVDNLYLEINGLRFSPVKWTPFKVSPQYTSSWGFNLVDKVNREQIYMGKLIATIDGKEYKSREFEVGI